MKNLSLRIIILPISEIADFSGCGVGCSKNVRDHVPVEAVERFVSVKLNQTTLSKVTLN